MWRITSAPSASPKRLSGADLLILFLNTDVGCFPDEVLAAVHGDHLSRNGRRAQEVANGCTDVGRIGAGSENCGLALSLEMLLALPRIDHRRTRGHSVDANAGRECLRQCRIEPVKPRFAEAV